MQWKPCHKRSRQRNLKWFVWKRRDERIQLPKCCNGKQRHQHDMRDVEADLFTLMDTDQDHPLRIRPQFLVIQGLYETRKQKVQRQKDLSIGNWFIHVHHRYVSQQPAISKRQELLPGQQGNQSILPGEPFSVRYLKGYVMELRLHLVCMALKKIIQIYAY